MTPWWWSWLLTAWGIAGLVLAGRRRAVGWAIGLSAQGAWIAYAVTTRQWGFIASACAYGLVYGRNWWAWRSDAVTAEDKEPKFRAVPGTDAECFIQWKGTDVCIDVHCPCGSHGHFDGDFAYALRCATCGAVYEMGTQVLMRKMDAAEIGPEGPIVKDLESAR